MELMERLNATNQIITHACACFEQAERRRRDAEVGLANAKKNRRVISWMIFSGAIGAFVMVTIMIEEISRTRDISMAMPTVIIFMIAMLILFKRITSRRSPGAQRAYDEGMQLALRDEEEGKKIIDANRGLLSFLPYEYWYPMATEYILRMVQTGRAKTINEALVLYDEYLHRWKIENANAAIVANQQAQTYALQGIRRSSAVSAAANVASAAANIGRLFS